MVLYKYKCFFIVTKKIIQLPKKNKKNNMFWHLIKGAICNMFCFWYPKIKWNCQRVSINLLWYRSFYSNGLNPLALVSTLTTNPISLHLRQTVNGKKNMTMKLLPCDHHHRQQLLQRTTFSCKVKMWQESNKAGVHLHRWPKVLGMTHIDGLLATLRLKIAVVLDFLWIFGLKICWFGVWTTVFL